MSETGTVTLADWLLSQIAADEAAARAAHEWVGESDLTGIAYAVANPLVWHQMQHDPAHVLAVAAAHRTIVEIHSTAHGICLVCSLADEYDGSREDWPCPTLRALASAYAGREGWQEAWR